MDSAANAGEHETNGTPMAGDEPSPMAEGHQHQWYDDDFCPGGGRFIGEGQKMVACPVCGEQMDVDADGYLFKHRPRIPKSTL